MRYKWVKSRTTHSTYHSRTKYCMYQQRAESNYAFIPRLEVELQIGRTYPNGDQFWDSLSLEVLLQNLCRIFQLKWNSRAAGHVLLSLSNKLCEESASVDAWYARTCKFPVSQNRMDFKAKKWSVAVSKNYEGQLPGQRDNRPARPVSHRFQFSNICGTVYRQGNVLFTPDGNSLLSPVGNRVSVFDLVK